MQVPKAPTDALRALESTTAALVAALMAEQAAAGPRGGLVSVALALSPSSPAQNPTQNATPTPTGLAQTQTQTQTLELPARHVALSELQRLKRQFVAVHRKAITLGTVEKGAVDWGEAAVADKFARFLEAHLGG